MAKETLFKHHDMRVEQGLYADGGLVTWANSAFFVKTTGNDANDGKSWTSPKLTIQAAVDAASARDIIFVGPGSYAEKVTVNKNSITIIGMVGPGQRVAIAPTGANDIAVTVEGTAAARTSNTSLVNLSCEGKGTGGGLHVKGNVRNLRAFGCNFEGASAGAGFGVRLESTAAGSVGRCNFVECEFSWADTALHFKVSGAGNSVTQTYVYRCRFHNFATAGIHVDTTHSADLWVEGCFFGDKEDGSQPTDFVLADVASTTGFFSGNSFATPTNAATVLTIAAGVHWGPNGTEAGWSTARPA